ncbi:P-loop containing nucleoside triphosphate hydrolase protein [Collybia nuda]|uniref:P-loop containing nucleoside triphosphate hydrolase protein n=1 Tax=Collybia nuda TaxID=64659 RepID=A0A9P6CBF7_9AGAR|nr:P-loop containing nucleoside triphosphate hydrolase protein [Collybia nuda]
MQLTELSGSQYAARRKELLALLKQLRATGAEGELQLPRIIVIGNQSAGKSSVVEAISGISVPRDAGTCTRCPMECRLSGSSGTWSCQISIRRAFDAFGNALDKVSEIPFGKLITNKEDVEPALRRAQIATLNPQISLGTIASQTMAELADQSYASNPSLQFSRDTICVDLEGPELTDLAFIDLPGLIQNADPQLVNLVEGVVKSHIEGYGLILVALPMTDDIENQKALWLANKADPKGLRTIGVLTKPDMLLPSSVKATELWLDVIEGRRHPLTHGYYCTRSPDDSERAAGVTPTQSRESEITFFSETTPWSTSTHKDRFGTNHLISTLSTLLVGNVHDTLPTINKEAERLLELTNTELATIPKEPDSEPATYMLRLISSFCDDIQRQVVGGFDVGTLVQENKESYAIFKKNIRETAPNFMPFPKPSSFVFGVEVSSGKHIRDQVDSQTKADPCYLDDMRRHIKSSIARELPNNVPFLAKEHLIVEFQKTWPSHIDTCFLTVYNSTKMAAEWCVEQRFKQFGKLAADVKTHVFELIHQRFAICMEILRPILEAEKTPYTQNTHYLSDSCAKWMAKYKDGRTGKNNNLELATKKRKFSEDSFEGRPSPTSPVSTFRAASKPITVSSRPTNYVVHETAPAQPTQKSTPTRSSWSHGNRGKKSSVEPGEDTTSDKEAKITNALASLAELGYIGLTTTDLGKLNPTDEYESELQVMAEVRGYFQIAYKRIIDNVPSLIDLVFVKPVGKELQAFLISKFSLGAADANNRCALYLAESPVVTARRKELLAKKERLEAVQRALRDFGLT